MRMQREMASATTLCRVTLWLPAAQSPYYLFALYAVLASAVVFFSGALRGIHIGSDLRFVERLDEAPYPPLDALPCWSHVFTVSRAPKVPVGFAFEGSVFEVSLILEAIVARSPCPQSPYTGRTARARPL